MGLRQYLNENPVVTAGLIIGALAIAAAVAFWQLRGGGGGISGGYWFYDVNTGETFPADPEAIPPIQAPSGQNDAEGRPAGVRAYVFSCGSCDDEDERFIGYLETNTAEAQQARLDLAQIPEAMEGGLDPANPVSQRIVKLRQQIDSGLRRAAPEAPIKWHPPNAQEYKALVSSVNQRCGAGQLPTECYPTK